MPFWPQFWLHLCPRCALFFIKKSAGFQVSKWIKNGSQNDSIFGPNSTLVSMKKCIVFLIDFWTHVGSIFEAFLKQIRLRIHASTGKSVFLKMSVSPARGAHFHGFGSPKSIQKSIKNQLIKRSHFLQKKIQNNHGKWTPNCLQTASKKR